MNCFICRYKDVYPREDEESPIGYMSTRARCCTGVNPQVRLSASHVPPRLSHISPTST